MSNKQHTIEFVRDFFKNEKCELLSTVYKNAHGRLDYIAQCGHKHNDSFHYFKNGKKDR